MSVRHLLTTDKKGNKTKLVLTDTCAALVKTKALVPSTVPPRWAPMDMKCMEVILRISILILCCTVAFASRLFAVVKFESVIHEFDP